MGKKLTAPKIEYYIDWLGSIRYHEYDYSFSYDERTYEMLDEIYSLLRKIAPLSDSDRGIRELWFKADRGPIEDFGNYKELYDDKQVQSYEDFRSWWLSEFPSETVWYNFTSIDDISIGFRSIFIGNKYVIEQDPRKVKSMKNDISEFTEWILECVRECIQQIENGLYNNMVERDIPLQHRTGTILRKDLWDVLPELREDFFSTITEADVAEFLAIISKLPNDVEYEGFRLPTLSANDFYECCSIGYKAIGFDIKGMTLREQYERYADGRDEGLGEINADSPEAFQEWYLNKECFGGHPWEVCRGGNSSHIDLYVCYDEKGYYFEVTGSAVSRSIDAIKFFLALHRAGKPVWLSCVKQLTARLNETEKIGIVPEGVTPIYCSSMFPDEEIIDFMNLPFEKRDDIASRCIWQPIHKAELL